MKAGEQRRLDPFEPRDKSCKRWCHFVGHFVWRGRNTVSLRSPFAIPVERWSTPGGRKSRRELFGYATRADFRDLETKREKRNGLCSIQFSRVPAISLRIQWNLFEI